MSELPTNAATVWKPRKGMGNENFAHCLYEFQNRSHIKPGKTEGMMNACLVEDCAFCNMADAPLDAAFVSDVLHSLPGVDAKVD